MKLKLNVDVGVEVTIALVGVRVVVCDHGELEVRGQMAPSIFILVYY